MKAFRRVESLVRAAQLLEGLNCTSRPLFRIECLGFRGNAPRV